MFSLPLNFALPSRCICGEKIVRDNNSICAECFDKHCLPSAFSCKKCGNPLDFDFGGSLCGECISGEHEFDGARFVLKYNEFTSKIISRFKYSDKTFTAKKIADLMINKLKNFDENIDMVISIPLDRKKLILRKYNQSALLATIIAKKLKVKCNNQILFRKKSVTPQASLNRAERLKNMTGVFSVKPESKRVINSKNILIIDDVLTTGATINEAVKTLKKNGASKVYALTFAKTFKHH